MDEHYAPSVGSRRDENRARSARITIFSVAQERRSGESGEALILGTWSGCGLPMPPGTPDAGAVANLS